MSRFIGTKAVSVRTLWIDTNQEPSEKKIIMVKHETFVLENGLRVLVHPDKNTSIAVMNIIYDVGARDEDPDKTGFAHLFEHLMFGGSVNVPEYDDALQRAGGENNAFTSSDITNYYLTLPSNNIETGFWLESDRMLGLSFDPRVLEVQRKVVIEEFKQRYLNKPYGDVWHKLRALAYEEHPYKWPVIGKNLTHIEQATMEDVKEFFYSHYVPNRAVLVVAGNIDPDQIYKLSEKWFGEIPRGKDYVRNLPGEPVQKSGKFLEVASDVPLDALYKTFHMPGRFDERYHATDLLGDMLGRGKSSRLYEQLVKKSKLFSNISCYVLGSVDPGLLVVSGTVHEGVDIREADRAVEEIIYDDKLSFGQNELKKVKNQALASHEFSKVEVLDRAMGLAIGAIAGRPEYINEESGLISSVNMEEVSEIKNSVLQKNNECTLYYCRQN